MAVPENYSAASLADHAGHNFGVSSPIQLSQDRIDAFARCTGDNQWIHVDVERARRKSPFGTTIAHGMLMLSLIPAVQFELGVYPKDARGVLNYGIEKVRFLAPVPAGAAIAMQVEIAAVEAKGAGRFLVRCANTAFIAGAPETKVMVGESLGMVLV